MKSILKKLAFATVMLASLASFARADDFYDQGFFTLDGINRRPDINQSTGIFTVSKFGNLVPGMSGKYDIGTPTQTYRFIYVRGIVASTAILNVSESWSDVPAASTVGYLNISKSTTSWSNSTGTLLLPVLFSSSVVGGYPRNITVQADYLDLIGSNTFTANLVVVGTNALGNSDTETINFSTAAGTGNVAWSFVQSLTVTASSVPAGIAPNPAKVAIGTGNKLGLANQLTAATDVYSVTITTGLNASAFNPTSQTVNSVYNTWQPSLVPGANADYAIRYHGKVSP